MCNRPPLFGCGLLVRLCSSAAAAAAAAPQVNLPAAQLQVAMGLPLHMIPDIRRMYGREPYGTDHIDFNSGESEGEKERKGRVGAPRDLLRQRARWRGEGGGRGGGGVSAGCWCFVLCSLGMSCVVRHRRSHGLGGQWLGFLGGEDVSAPTPETPLPPPPPPPPCCAPPCLVAWLGSGVCEEERPPAKGHCIAVRITAENPDQGFQVSARARERQREMPQVACCISVPGATASSTLPVARRVTEHSSRRMRLRLRAEREKLPALSSVPTGPLHV